MVGTTELIRKQGWLLGLIVVLGIVFLLQLVFGPQGYVPFTTIPAEISASWENLWTGSISGADLRTFSTLLSSAFLHGGIEHLFLNVVFLWIFAALTTELLGPRWMLAIFVFSAIAGSIGHTVLNSAEAIPMLGASGAVMGFMGAYLGMAVRWELPDPHIWPMSRPVPPANLAILAVIGIIMDFVGVMDHERTGIAYGAHIGGFLAGLFVTSFVVSRSSLRSEW